MEENKQLDNMTEKIEQGFPQSIYKNQKPGFINEFLWTCAGVDKPILRECPSDWSKYAGIGGMILFTAIMAGLSGGYALNFVFHDEWFTILFGIFWGLLIFNLDRFIVNTMYSDGKHSISWGELRSGLPRIIMAIFLGIVISTPLELKIFEDKINMEVENEKERILEEEKLVKYHNRIEKIDEEIQTIQETPGLNQATVNTGNTQINNLNNQINDLYSQILSENSIINTLQNKKRNLNPSSANYSDNKLNIEKQLAPHYSKRNQLKKQHDDLITQRNGLTMSGVDLQNQDIEEKRIKIGKLNNEKDSLSKIINTARETHPNYTKDEIKTKGSLMDKINLEYRGFNSQLKAFHDIRDKEFAIDIAAWFVMLLFVIIETAPTFLKMMMEDGPYDSLLKAEKHEAKVKAMERISNANDTVNTEVKISTMKNQKRLEAEMLANEEILKKLAAVQAELLNKSIDAWREEELKKIAQDPKSYLQIKVKPEK